MLPCAAPAGPMILGLQGGPLLPLSCPLLYIVTHEYRGITALLNVTELQHSASKPLSSDGHICTIDKPESKVQFLTNFDFPPCL